LAECRENRPVTVSENAIKKILGSLFRNGEGSGKIDPESVSGTGSSPKVNQFF